MILTRPVRSVLLAALLATLTGVAACTGGGGSATDNGQPPPGQPDVDEVSWQPCPELPEEAFGELVGPAVVRQMTERMTYECATIEVPQNWAEPDGPTFDVAISRARHQDQSDRIGSLVINPGGPGASGVDTSVFLTVHMFGLPEQVLQRFDVVGFDPRGVARSSPVECTPDEELDEMFGADPDPVSEQEFAEALADSERNAQRCGDKYGESLQFYSTHQTAYDLDAIRAAVGDEQLTYLGFSYGTLIGAVYAHLFPDNIRAMVLDGAIDPQRDMVERSRGQAEGFERAFDNFAEWCAGEPQTCPLEPDARTAVTEAFEQASHSPATGADGRQATEGWVSYAVLSSLYHRDYWPMLAAAIDQLAQGDPTGVFDLADQYADRSSDGQYSNLWDANRAINCADARGEVSRSQVRDLQQQWREDYPLFGASSALGLLSCEHWPAEPDPYPTGPAEGAPPIVVVGTTGDPATPYEATQALADRLGVGVVVTYDGEGHTAYPEAPCVAELVDAYLIDLTVPEDGARC